MFAFLAGKGTPRHVAFALPRALEPAEAVALQGRLMAVPGVVVARVLADPGRVHVVYRSGATHARALAALLAELGLPPRPLPEGELPRAAPRDACC